MTNRTSQQESRSICRDFVRGRCIRPFCRVSDTIFFLRCSNIFLLQFPHVMSPESVIFCHDFQNASCQRINCRFLHYSLQEEEYYRTYNILPTNEPKTCNQFCKDMVTYGQCCHSIACRSLASPTKIGHKRSSVETRYESPKRFRECSEDFDVLAIIRRLDEEHKNLRRRIETNEIKINDLRASNEYLMQQNAQIRLTNVQCSRTVTNTTTAQPHTTVIGAVSMAPVQVQASPIVTMAAPQAQLITNSGQPLGITSNTSQGQLALSQQTLTTSQCPHSQILSTSQITLAPAMAPAPSIGLTINTSQALAMSNSTQPIISYPVMTHSILPH